MVTNSVPGRRPGSPADYSEVQHFVRSRVPGMSPDECVTDWPYARIPKLNRPKVVLRTTDGRRRFTSATRYAFTVLHGREPVGQLNHGECDNPECWNPHHVYEGTHADNMRDRFARGKRGVRARLTIEQANTIRERLAAGALGKDLAAEFGVGKSTISLIKSGRIYR